MNGNVIRTITIKGTSEGLDKLEGDLKKVAAAQENVAVVSEQSAKRVLSLEDAWKRQTLRLDEAARSQANMAREQKVAEQAMRQGIVTQQQYAERLDLINQKYGQATVAQKAFATATSGVSAQLVAMTAGAGPVGVFLSALGPWGMAAAAGIGLASAALSHMTEEAARIGNKAADLKKFSDITGLTAEQLRAINKVGGEAGVSSDELATAIGRFTTNMDKARDGGGELYEQIRKINPALADQLAASTSTAEALDVYAKAIKNARDSGDTFQRNALAQAGGGRGGRAAGLALANVAEAGGIDAITAKTREASGVTNEWVANVAKLTRENEKLLHQIADMKANAYAQEVLERQNQFLKGQKELVALGLSAGRQRAMPGGITEQPDADMFQEAFGRSSRPGNLAADAGLGDIATSVGKSAADAIDPLSQLRSELAKTANDASAAQSALGQYADGVEKLITQQERLTLAFLNGTINADQYTRANDAIQQHITYVEQLRVTYGTVNDAANQQLQTLQLQTNLANARTASEQQAAQYAIAYAQAYAQVKDAAIATQIATAQMAQQQAQINAEADKRLKSLQEEGELLRAGTEEEKDRLKARQEYDRLIRNNVDPGTAGQIAATMQGNARIARDSKETAVSWNDISAAFVKSQNAAEAMAINMQQTAASAQSAANDAERISREASGKPILFGALSTMPKDNPYIEGKTAWLDYTTQFNPAGYKSTIGPSPTQIAMAEQQKKIDAYQAALDAQRTTPNTTRYTPETEGIRKQIEALQLRNQSLPTAGNAREIERLTKLADAIEEQTRATKDNTSATQAMTDVLSPFYSTDPRNMRLGFRAFAGGGIMTPYGELPLKHYASSGIATSPQVAVFGEGSTPEAYVPAPSGKIPVKLDMPANSNNKPVVVNINIRGDADAGTVAALKSTAFQQAQSMRRVMR